MRNPISLCGRGLRYVRQYGPAQFYFKIKERRERNRLEAGYDAWLKAQLPTKEETKAQRERVFPYMPVISILVPAYETPELFLRQMMDSVLGQSYGNLELCLADGSRTDRVQRVAEAYRAKDGRVRYERLVENRGISENTNAALRLATGDYVGLLDHDDVLLPGALYEVVKALQAVKEYGREGEKPKEEQPEADVIYTDEDKVNLDLTRHFQPHFKPDFNLEYLRSNNYICHFFVAKRRIALEAGGFLGAFDGAQDHDFIFRCTERAKRIVHVPKVLYSWRSHEASTAANPESKLYAYEAGKRAVAAHLERAKEPGTLLDTHNYGFYRVRYEHRALPEESRLSGILINISEDFHGQSPVNVVYYDKACNKFVTFSGKKTNEDKGNYVLFTCVRKGRTSEDFWPELLSVCERQSVGMACARVYDRRKRLTNDLRMQGAADPFGTGTKGLREGCAGYFHRACLQQELLEPTDCFLVKTELLEKIGDWEELSVTELAETIRKRGYKLVYDPWAVLYEDR